MPGWMDRLTGKDPQSANQAKERLQLVLIHDRTDLSADELDQLKDELLRAISRYVEIDPSSVRIQMAQDGREQRLVADIPIKTSRKRRTG